MASSAHSAALQTPHLSRRFVPRGLVCVFCGALVNEIGVWRSPTGPHVVLEIGTCASHPDQQVHTLVARILAGPGVKR